MVINSHEPAKDRNKQNRENKNRVKKVIDTGKEKGITLETPKTCLLYTSTLPTIA